MESVLIKQQVKEIKELLTEDVKAGKTFSFLKKKYNVSASFIYNALYDNGIKYKEILDERKRKLKEENFARCYNLYVQLCRMPNADEIKEILIYGGKPSTYINLLHEHFQTGPFKKQSEADTKLRAVNQQELLNDLRKITLELDRLPLVRDIKKYSIYEPREFINFFGTYKTALKKAGLENIVRQKNKKFNHAKKRNELISYLVEKTRVSGHLPSKKEMDADPVHNYTEYYRMFGSLKKSLKMAEILTGSTFEKQKRKFTRKSNPYYADENLLQHLKDLAAKLGRTPHITDLKNENKYSHVVYHKRFGSWKKALVTVGLLPPSVLSSYLLNNRSKILKWVADYTSAHHIFPTRAQVMKEFEISNKAFYTLFGSYKNLLYQAGHEV